MRQAVTLCIHLLFIVAYFTACDKQRDDFEKGGRLRGRLSYYNPYTQSDLKPLAGASVRLAYSPSDTLNFLYDAVTDSAGYFSFTRTDPGKKYDLFYEDSIDHVKYAAFVTRQPDNDTISLVALPRINNQNGFTVHATDNNGNVVPNVSFCVFNNRTLALADTCTGSFMQFITSGNGTFTKYNLPAGTYYFRSRLKAGNTILEGFDTVNIPAAGIRDIPVVLRPVTVNKNGFEILLVDPSNTPVYNAGICVFTSKSLFMADTCLGNILHLNTDFYGKAGFYNLAPGRYFLRAELLAGNTRLKGTDSLILDVTGITSKIILMK